MTGHLVKQLIAVHSCFVQTITYAIVQGDNNRRQQNFTMRKPVLPSMSLKTSHYPTNDASCFFASPEMSALILKTTWKYHRCEQNCTLHARSKRLPTNQQYAQSSQCTGASWCHITLAKKLVHCLKKLQNVRRG